MGCDKPYRNLIPYVIPPEDIVPGEATWYATTCRECPAGCGILAKNRDGHIIKVEGNPLHPVNGGHPWGKLCPRGQASVQTLYNPDRYQSPLKRTSDGKIQPISWTTAEQMLLDNLSSIIQKGRGERVVFLTDLITGTRKDLIDRWLGALGSKGHIIYEPFAYEGLREANRRVFGTDAIPTYHLDRADCLISFGANFLETWLSNVQYARQFAVFRELRREGKNYFAYVGPRLSMTAANADLWIPVSPPGQSLVARGLLRALMDSGAAGNRKSLGEALVGNLSLDQVEQETGVNAQTIRTIAKRLIQAQRPLILAEGLHCSDPQATETATAVNLLCALLPGATPLLDFGDPSSLGTVAPLSKMKDLTERLLRGEVDLLLLNNVNPLFNLPPAWEFQKALKSVPMIVTFSSAPDETSEQANLILPTHTFFESWDDYSPRQSVQGLLQPAMGPIFNSRPFGDILISTGKKLGGEKAFPWRDSYEMLREAWSKKGKGAPAEVFWQHSMQKGGLWSEELKEAPKASSPAGIRFPFSSVAPEASAKGFHFVTYPTIQFFDGRSANRPFLQELPDPVTQITWGGWIEINPDTARQQGIEKDDVLKLRSPYGVLEAPAFPYPGIPAGILAMPIGQGHMSNGRYTRNESGNPVQIIPPALDSASGGLVWAASGVTIEKTGKVIPLANVDGSMYQHDRNIVQSVSLAEYQRAGAERTKPRITMPLPEGWDKKVDFYPPHRHDIRWAMVVDLDRCIGCGACVMACYVENNVPWVGKKQVLKGRKASWLQVQRYFQKDEPRVRFLPMMCQHCDEAPCESVCPVFAPNHGKEGINNQVYNRCIGTRFCSQNCPYKIRRFNWFTFSRPEPMHWMLNPDVTVRMKGVMEKCSFCIQRVVQAKSDARSENRKLKDQEFTTACAQTCPAEVLTFGNILDPQSRVSKLIQDPRAYQVLGHLNTKPGVIYLKKVDL